MVPFGWRANARGRSRTLGWQTGLAGCHGRRSRIPVRALLLCFSAGRPTARSLRRGPRSRAQAGPRPFRKYNVLRAAKRNFVSRRSNFESHAFYPSLANCAPRAAASLFFLPPPLGLAPARSNSLRLAPAPPFWLAGYRCQVTRSWYFPARVFKRSRAERAGRDACYVTARSIGG